MEKIEGDLCRLLQGQALSIPGKSVDVPGSDPGYIPKLKQNVGYVVCAVLFNKKGDILMKQEAREGRKGKWYLPAGKVKPNESLEEAIKREVAEDTGYHFIPRTLLAVESRSGFWYRFTFTGTITGGAIKTTADSHQSLQAKWFPIEDIRDQQGITLRSDDMLTLIDSADAHHCHLSCHPDTMPVVKAHETIIYRLVLVFIEDNGKKLSVLTNAEIRPHLPTAHVSQREDFVSLASHKIIKQAFMRDDIRTTFHGLISMEYCGQPAGKNDGICLTLLASTEDRKQIRDERYRWVRISGEMLRKSLIERMKTGMTVPFLDVI